MPTGTYRAIQSHTEYHRTIQNITEPIGISKACTLRTNRDRSVSYRILPNTTLQCQAVQALLMPMVTKRIVTDAHKGLYEPSDRIQHRSIGQYSTSHDNISRYKPLWVFVAETRTRQNERTDKAMAKTATKTETITLNPIQTCSMTICIEGDSDLILRKKSRSFELSEIFKQSHPKGTQIPAELNQPYNLWEHLITSIHWQKPIVFHDEDWSLYSEEEWNDYMTNNTPLVLGKAFQDSLKEAFISCGFKESTGKAGTDFKRTISIAPTVPVTFSGVQADEHLAKANDIKGTNVLTQANVFSGWRCEIPIVFLETAFPKQTIIELFNVAGTFIGIGSRRGEGFGRYHVASVK